MPLSFQGLCVSHRDLLRSGLSLIVLGFAKQLQRRRSGTARRLLVFAHRLPYVLVSEPCNSSPTRGKASARWSGGNSQDATVFCALGPYPSSPPLVGAESPSYYSRLSSYTQTLSADTLVYLALRVTGRFICVKAYQFAEINGSTRHPAAAPCYARSTVLLPSKPTALVPRVSHSSSWSPPRPRATRPLPSLRGTGHSVGCLTPFSPWFSRLVGCVRLARSRQAGRATQRVQSHIALHRPMCSHDQD